MLRVGITDQMANQVLMAPVVWVIIPVKFGRGGQMDSLVNAIE